MRGYNDVPSYERTMNGQGEDDSHHLHLGRFIFSVIE